MSLHGWCGEEEAVCTLDPAKRSDNTAKIRWAQTADWGFLPNPRLPHTFIAMAYDQPDPRNGSHCFWNTTTHKCDNKPYPDACLVGKEICPPPAGLMGGNIHPRNKLLLGDRIARAAKAVVYGDAKLAFTGPVVTGCFLGQTDSGSPKITLSFNETLLRGEALRVRVTRGFEVRNAATGNWSWVTISSPLGVQAKPSVDIDVPAGTTVDAVRYNWLDNIACPGAYCDYTRPTANQSCDMAHPHNRGITVENFWWCFNPTETIALYTEASDLPAPPFTLEVSGARCVMPSGVVSDAMATPSSAKTGAAVVTDATVTASSPVLAKSSAPVGISAYAALDPTFPALGLMEFLHEFDQPFVSVLADFGRLYTASNLTMFVGSYSSGGPRAVNPQHTNALKAFVSQFCAATNRSSTRTLQLFVLNGPGQRSSRPLNQISYPWSAPEFNQHVTTDAIVRDELTRYSVAVHDALRSFVGEDSCGLQLRITPMLEDNMPLSVATALEGILLAPWRTHGRRLPAWLRVGRNPCPNCAPGAHSDGNRLPDDSSYWERHLNGERSVAPTLQEHKPGDTWCNDGWGIYTNATLVRDLTKVAQEHRLLFDYWYPPLQGYGADGTVGNDLRWDIQPATVAQWIKAGLALVPPQRPEPAVPTLPTPTPRHAYYKLSQADVSSPTWPAGFEHYSLFIANPGFTATELQRVRSSVPGSAVLAYSDMSWAYVGTGCSEGNGNFSKFFKPEWAVTNLRNNQPVCPFGASPTPLDPSPKIDPVAAAVLTQVSADALVRYHTEVTLAAPYDGLYMDDYEHTFPASWVSNIVAFTNNSFDTNGDGKADTVESLQAQYSAWKPYYSTQLRKALGDRMLLANTGSPAESDAALDGQTIEFEWCTASSEYFW